MYQTFVCYRLKTNAQGNNSFMGIDLEDFRQYLRVDYGSNEQLITCVILQIKHTLCIL